MQMDAYVAFASAGSQCPPPTANIVNAVTGPATSRADGATGFADGMQSLLAAMDGNTSGADSNSTPGGGDHQGAASAPSVETAEMGLPASASSAIGFPQRGARGAFNQPRFSPSVQPNPGDPPLAAKPSERPGASTASNAHLRDRNSKVRAERASEAALAQPIVTSDLSATAPAQVPVQHLSLQNFKEQPEHWVRRTPVSAPSLAFQSGEVPLYSALAGDLDDSTSVLQQRPATESVGALRPHAGLSPHAPQLIADPSAVADATPAHGPGTDVSATNPENASVTFNSGPASGPASGVAPASTRRTEAVASAGRPSKSALRSSASPSVGDSASLRLPAQGAAASTMPVRDAAGLEDRRSALTSPDSVPLIGDQDTFAALDSAASGPQTTWIHAGAHHAEAGYLDPALGWVSVRADGTAAGLHAALIPGSPEAASALGNQLAGLNAFMAEHQGHAATITLAAPEPGSQYAGTSQQDGAMNGQQQQQEPNQAAPTARGVDPSQETDSATSRIAVPQAVAGSQARNGIGVHLSVMA